MLFLIGVLGLIAQVNYLVPLLSSPRSLTVLFSAHEDTFDDGTSTRNSRARYSSGLYLGMSSVFALSECTSVSTVIFATGCLRRYVRVYRLSYHTFSSLDHRGVDHHELVYLYYRNLTSITSGLFSAHMPIADKEEDCHPDWEWYHLGAVSGWRCSLRPR